MNFPVVRASVIFFHICSWSSCGIVRCVLVFERVLDKLQGCHVSDVSADPGKQACVFAQDTHIRGMLLVMCSSKLNPVHSLTLPSLAVREVRQRDVHGVLACLLRGRRLRWGVQRRHPTEGAPCRAWITGQPVFISLRMMLRQLAPNSMSIEPGVIFIVITLIILQFFVHF